MGYTSGQGKNMNPTKVNVELRSGTTISFGFATVDTSDQVYLVLRDEEGAEFGRFFMDAVAGWWFEDNPS
jgi:hypothetical protein